MPALRQMGRFLVLQLFWVAGLCALLLLPAPLPWQLRLVYGLLWGVFGQWLFYLLLAFRKAGDLAADIGLRATGTWLDQLILSFVTRLTAVLLHQTDRLTLDLDARRALVAQVWNDWQPELDLLLDELQYNAQMRDWLPPRLMQIMDQAIRDRYRQRLHTFVNTGIEEIVATLPPWEAVQQAGSNELADLLRTEVTQWVENNWGDTLRLLGRGWHWLMVTLWVLFLLPLIGWGFIVGLAWLWA